MGATCDTHVLKRAEQSSKFHLHNAAAPDASTNIDRSNRIFCLQCLAHTPCNVADSYTVSCLVLHQS